MSVSVERAAEAFHEAVQEDDPALLYDQAPCGYLSTSPTGEIIKVNATFCTWLAVPADDLLGTRFVDLLTPGGRIYHETHFGPMVRLQGFVREMAVDLLRRDGGRLPVLLNASLVRSEDGEPQVIRIAVFDATERRAYEQELMRARDAALVAEARADALAQTLRRSFIPPVPPRVPGLHVGTGYQPAVGTEVGGDFYDVFPSAPQEWTVTLGDVSGKGVDAAVVTSVARSTVQALTALGHTATETLQGLNEVMRQNVSDKFCTIVLARLRREGQNWRVTLVVGGHPPPLLVREGVAPRFLDADGPLVGVLPQVDYVEHDLVLTPADTLVLYTDGITEAKGEVCYFGEERLLSWAAGQRASDASGLVEGLLETVMEFQDGRPRDDIAVVALRPE